MHKLNSIKPESVFGYFEEISSIPRGSANMTGIADYCVRFAKEHGLEYFRDAADNVIIRKPATAGYESSEPVILQGHLDMVCQKTAERNIDFEHQGLDIYADKDYLKARGTTLGADNGIAVAMILSVLSGTDLAHPAIEAVFTTDEEIGMVGASALDMSQLRSRRMINLDSEEDDTVTVSCAGGCDLSVTADIKRTSVCKTELSVVIKGLRGGHSGVEINKGRINANMLAGRFLNHMNGICDFELTDINGGDKGNAIPQSCELTVCTDTPDLFTDEAKAYFSVIAKEASAREPELEFEILSRGEKECSAFPSQLKEKLIFALACMPDGVQQMSAEIEGLVETSLNLGILKTSADSICMLFTLRSNKSSSLHALEEKLSAFAKQLDFEYKTGGHYPPWEYRESSPLRQLFCEVYTETAGQPPKVEAIHAGLECAVFASKLRDLDCIAIGPTLYDVHTVNERLHIPSVAKIYYILCELLRRCN